MVKADGQVPLLPQQIRQWIAKNLAVGYSAEAVCLKLVGLGYDKLACNSEIAEVMASPAFAAAVQLAKSRNKLGMLLDTLAHQFRHCSAAGCVPTMDPPDSEVFFDQYYYGNRPVIVRGLMSSWAALDKWTPEWFRTTHGAVIVEVTSGRNSDPRFEENFERNRTAVSLGDFISTISKSPGNDMYLVSKNRMLDQPEFASLLSDFDAPRGFLRPDTRRNPGLWFGPGGTTTPLHHDSTNIFFAQVFGSKRIRLIPPFEIENIYNERSCYSAVDLDSPDFARFPRLVDVTVLDVTVVPGDFLLIPVGWWHTVQSLSTSISLSFQNFAIDGTPVVWAWRELGAGSRSVLRK
jgi:Cupin-like domain